MMNDKLGFKHYYSKKEPKATMENEEYHLYVRELISRVISNEYYSYRILIEPLAKISTRDCLFWTIGIVVKELKPHCQDELSLRTIEESEKLKTNYNEDKAKIFDEL